MIDNPGVAAVQCAQEMRNVGHIRTGQQRKILGDQPDIRRGIASKCRNLSNEARLRYELCVLS